MTALPGQMRLFHEPIRFDGETYEPGSDKARLSSQLHRVFALMIDGKYRTLEEIHRLVGGSMPGVSARLRDFRKERFGSFIVHRRRRGDAKRGVFEYRLDAKLRGGKRDGTA